MLFTASRIRSILIAFVVFVLALTACTNQGQVSYVIFTHREQNTFEIYSVDIEGKNLQLLANIQPQNSELLPSSFQFELSPRGKYLAYIDTDGLYVLELGTQKTRYVSQYARSASPYGDVLKWSPDETMLAFYGESTVDSNSIDIYIYHPSNNEVLNLTVANYKPTQIQLVWSPDSHYLAFPTIPGPQYSIFGVGTNQLVQQSNLSLDDAYPGVLGVCNAAWSPDGKYLAFVVGCSTIDPAFVYETYLMDTTDGTLTPVTDLVQDTDVGTVVARMKPHWSPEGHLVLIEYVYGRPSYLAESHLPEFTDKGFILFDATNKKTVASVTAPLSIDEHIAWSINNELVWISREGWQYATLNDGNLALSKGFDIPLGCRPLWSPSGDFFAYTGSTDQNCANTGGDHSIYVYNHVTNTLDEITKSLGGYNLLLGWIED